MPKKLWFKAKTYGYGWYPVTWQGWLVLAIYLIGLYGSYFLLLNGPIQHHSPQQEIIWAAVELLVIYIILTGLLIYIARKTGEVSHWRWGDKNKK